MSVNVAKLSLIAPFLVDKLSGNLKMDRLISFGLGALITCYLLDPEPFEVLWGLTLAAFG
jgi:hypothetical protein